MPPQDIAFKRLLAATIEETLLQILGESGRKAVFFHMQHVHSLPKEDILNNPELFAQALEQIFGAGAKVIETTIIKNLHKKLGLPFKEKRNYKFTHYINHIVETTQKCPT